MTVMAMNGNGDDDDNGDEDEDEAGVEIGSICISLRLVL